MDFSLAELRVSKETVSTQASSIKAVETKKEVVSTVENRVRIMEDLSRASNLRVTGVEEQQGETDEQTKLEVLNIITDNL